MASSSSAPSPDHPKANGRRAPLPLEAHADETHDSICGGLVQVLQRKGGYRFNLDPILLAHFAASHRGLKGPVLDLGTGAGIIPLILARKFGVEATGLEVQPALFHLAERNVQLNRCERRIALVLGDWRAAEEKFPPGAFSDVLSNPPYRAPSAGRINPHAERAMARHELAGTLNDLCTAAGYLLADHGALWLVYPASRLPELVACLGAHHMEPKRLRFVHPRAHQPAKLLLIQAVKKGRSGLAVEPPLALHSREGPGFTPEVEAMLSGGASPAQPRSRPAAPGSGLGPPTR